MRSRTHRVLPNTERPTDQGHGAVTVAAGNEPLRAHPPPVHGPYMHCRHDSRTAQELAVRNKVEPLRNSSNPRLPDAVPIVVCMSTGAAVGH